MVYTFASARHDERNKYSGGSAGDQLQTSKTKDTKGEVSMQTLYNHAKGWYCLRWKNVEYSKKFAENVKKLVNDPNIGYDQGNRLSIMNYNGKTKVECDCSSLMRRAIKDTTGKDVGNFTTQNEKTVLLNSGFFTNAGTVTTASTLYTGDILVTKTQGHTGAIVQGHDRASSKTKCPYTEPTAILKYNSKGEGVKWLQWHLIKAGYLKKENSKGETSITGLFGDKTKEAVIKLQQKYPNCGTNGKPDGLVGANTRAKLKALV